MRALRGLLVSWLLLAILVGSSASGQQDQIPRELALALIPYGGGEGGEIIVGQLPPDLATTFTLPPGARVLGSFVSLSYIQMVMTFPGTPDSAQAFANRSLSEHGWTARDRSPARMGGLQYGPHFTVPTSFCKPAATGIAETMNHRKPSEVLRILRDHTPALFPDPREEEEMVRTLRRRREVGGNDQPAV